MRVPLFRWQHRLHRWTSDALLLRSHGPARRDSDAPTHRGARPPSGGCLDARPHRWRACRRWRRRRAIAYPSSSSSPVTHPSSSHSSHCGTSGSCSWRMSRRCDERHLFKADAPSTWVQPLRQGGKGRDDLVFTSLRGGVLRGSIFRPRVFNKAVQAVQKATTMQRAQELATTGAATTPVFPTITPHDLRHTAASLAVSSGANIKAVQRMLGHAKASMTLDVYADLFDEDLDVVADRLDTAIKSASAGSLRGTKNT